MDAIKILIEQAIQETEKALAIAKISQAACEAEVYDIGAEVREAEAIWETEKTENAGIALDRLYHLHDNASRELYNATDDAETLDRVLDLLKEASWKL